MNTNQIYQSRDRLLDAGQTIGTKMISATQENVNAGFELFSQALSVRSTEDVKTFWSNVARETRQCVERSVALMKDTGQDWSAFSQDAQHDISRMAEDVAKQTKKSR